MSLTVFFERLQCAERSVIEHHRKVILSAATRKQKCEPANITRHKCRDEIILIISDLIKNKMKIRLFTQRNKVI